MHVYLCHRRSSHRIGNKAIVCTSNSGNCADIGTKFTECRSARYPVLVSYRSFRYGDIKHGVRQRPSLNNDCGFRERSTAADDAAARSRHENRAEHGMRIARQRPAQQQQPDASVTQRAMYLCTETTTLRELGCTS